MNRKFKNLGVNNFHLESSFYSEWFEDKKDLKLDGEVIGYMSKRLNQVFVENIHKNPLFTPVAAKKIAEQIKKKGIIPVYSSKYWIGDILDTFTNVFLNSSGYILGFFDGKKIVTIVTNLRELDGTISQKELYSIITHEFQHKFANSHTSYSTNPAVKKALRDWYTAFIDEYFKESISPKLKMDLLNFWQNIKVENGDKVSKIISRRYDSLVETFNALDDSEPGKEPLGQLIDYVADKYTNNMYDPRSSDIFWAGKKAYDSLGVKSNTLVYQEFLIASEVTAVVFSTTPTMGNQSLITWL